MIHVYDRNNTDFDKMGNAILSPVSGKLKQVAGGSYDLTMECALDPEGKWEHLVPGAILKVPVPEETIENAFAGESADIYVTNTSTALRETASAGGAVTYDAWNPNEDYTVGSKVTVSGWSHKNYQCVFFDEMSPQRQVPPYNSSWWKPISDGTEGGAAVVVIVEHGVDDDVPVRSLHQGVERVDDILFVNEHVEGHAGDPRVAECVFILIFHRRKER